MSERRGAERYIMPTLMTAVLACISWVGVQLIESREGQIRLVGELALIKAGQENLKNILSHMSVNYQTITDAKKDTELIEVKLKSHDGKIERLRRRVLDSERSIKALKEFQDRTMQLNYTEINNG